MNDKEKLELKIAKYLWGLVYGEPWENCACPNEWVKEARRLIRMIGEKK